MKNKHLVIFGVGEIAQLAHHYFTHESEFEVGAFTVDREFMPGPEYMGRPVIPFDEISSALPPSEYQLFIALGYSNLNRVRMEKYLEGKRMGYTFPSYVSSRAAYLSAIPAGDNCLILEGNTIQPYARIGNNVILWSGNHIGHHSVIGDHSFLASQVVVSGGVEIGERCFIGVNATLRDHIRVGERCVIGAGALLLSDAEAGGVYVGNATPRSRVPSSRLRSL
jgi:sugar O-acyltransferase (sialic acid O-acetyltransferase NeuD family)